MFDPGFQGADDAEKLGLSDQLFEAVLCELAVVGRGQPCLLVGDFNVEPTKNPCLLKGISAGLSIDLEAAWARAAGSEPSATCKRDWASPGGTRRDFVVGCPLAAAALSGCWVDGSRWVQPHLSVCAFGSPPCGLLPGLLWLTDLGRLGLLRLERSGLCMMSFFNV